MLKTCCFTGHRIIKITPELVQRLKDTIIELITQGVTDFYNGGAIGFDMLCAETVIQVWSTQEGEQRFENHVDKLMNYIRFWQASGESEKTSIA